MADLQTLPQPLTARAPRTGSRAHALLRFIRKVHLYFGVFISPALLFFAFTGALQTFSFHEQTQGSSYKPPAWLASLAQLHKKQTTEVPVRRPRPNFADNPQQPSRGINASGQNSQPTSASNAVPADEAQKEAGHEGHGHHAHHNASQNNLSQASPSQTRPSQTSPGQQIARPAASAPAVPNTTVAPNSLQSGRTPEGPRKSHLPMKIFFLIVSIGLFLSTVTGIYMSYKYTRRAWLITAVLITGVVLPLLLLPF